MYSRFSRRFFLTQLLLLAACRNKSIQSEGNVLIVGTVSYSQGQQILDQYAKFIDYLGEKTNSLVNLEPTFNENKALERIQSKAWTLVFAPPGLAAIAISQQQYRPLFPLEGITNLRSILVVRQDSPLRNFNQLEGKTLALGQPGSATGFYFPIYNLYGLTLAEILLAPTPETVLSWVADGKAAAGALSQKQFDLYKSQFGQTAFRVLYTDPHNVPLGVVLISPTVEPDRGDTIRQAMSQAPSILAQEAGYIPTAQVPNYDYMITVVQRVRSIFPYEMTPSNMKLKPARLFKAQ